MSLASTSAQSVRPGVLLGPLAVWFVMAVLAVANGVFRETVLIPRMSEYGAHVLSTLVLVAMILAVSAAFFRSTGTAYTDLELLAVGAAWTAATVGFEFLVGYVEGTPVSVTLGQYDVLAGQVWILVPVTLLVAPYLFGRMLSG